jgi:hypothetical protein
VSDDPCVAVQKELAFALWVFARTARSLPLYSPNNQTRAKMMAELDRAFARLFEGVEEVTLSVRPNAFFYDELAVLEEANVEPSVPYLFFRDGVRRIELSRGLNDRELEILVAATAQGLSRRGLDDDIVSLLCLAALAPSARARPLRHRRHHDRRRRRRRSERDR